MAFRPGTCAVILLALGGIVSRGARADSWPGHPTATTYTGRPPAAAQGSTPEPADPRFATRIVRRLPPVRAESPAASLARGGDRSETLDEAWSTALAVNQKLEAERWEVSAADHSLRSAQAMRWPALSVEGSYVARDAEPAFHFDFPGIPLATDTFPYAQDESFAFRTKVDLPLYTSGRIQHGIAAADARLSSAQFGLEQSEMDLRLRVAEDYVTVLRARREVELAESTVKSLEAHLRDVKLLFKYDQVPVNDLLAAQVSLADARQSAIQVRNQLDAGSAAYNRRLGRPLDSPVHIAELEAGAVAEDLESLTAGALQKRPALTRLKAQARALDHQAQSVVAENRPQIELRGEHAFEENRFRSPEGITSVGVGLSWNVLDFGRNRHEAAAVSDKAESARRFQAELESVIALEVRRAWLHVEETRRRREVTAEAVQQAEENLRVVRERYNSGMGIHTEVLDAEKLRTQAYRNHDNATYDAVLAVLRLRHAAGEL
ncbi:MAG TPA: TolC family protein [Thermoguttaceae bacterium]|nr:TolC family protein [Thermoguttaceae bacterium]